MLGFGGDKIQVNRDGGLCGIGVGEHVTYYRDLGRGREGVLRRLVIGVLM